MKFIIILLKCSFALGIIVFAASLLQYVVTQICKVWVKNFDIFCASILTVVHWCPRHHEVSFFKKQSKQEETIVDSEAQKDWRDTCFDVGCLPVNCSLEISGMTYGTINKNEQPKIYDFCNKALWQQLLMIIVVPLTMALICLFSSLHTGEYKYSTNETTESETHCEKIAENYQQPLSLLDDISHTAKVTFYIAIGGKNSDNSGLSLKEIIACLSLILFFVQFLPMHGTALISSLECVAQNKGWKWKGRLEKLLSVLDIPLLLLGFVFTIYMIIRIALY